METLYTLLGTCMFIFLFFSFYEIINLKKEVNKLNGIVKHLLKNISEKVSENIIKFFIYILLS